MYVTRIQISNYGPIERLDITFPIDEDGPKPIILVGENGSGKSVLLSHIVNGLMLAQQSAYPDTPEVELGKVYKLRSPQYITSAKEFSFARVDLTDNLWFGELQLNKRKQDYDAPPDGIVGMDAESLWHNMAATDPSHISPKTFNDRFRAKQIFQSNCILYFPPDRFEDPAWLNETNLNARAEHVDRRRIEGFTDRKVINYSPLRDNQNWVFDLAYDFSVFELQTSNVVVGFPAEGGSRRNVPLPVFQGFSGRAKTLYDVVLRILRLVIGKGDTLRLGIGSRHSRVVSVMSGNQMLVPNVFQLSSGEVSLLNLFLSILRDYDLTGNQLTQAGDISGIIVVDEIDLHLHAHHQCEILPKLMKMFPKVQFVVTSHSPLFVLGLQEIYGENGFILYHLPEGRPISPEEFGEFRDVYQAFANTRRHFDETRAAVRNAQKPLIFVDGKTDVEYHKKAAKMLGFNSMLDKTEFRDSGGMLGNIWKGLTNDHVEHKKVIVLHDPEERVESDTRANVYRRRIRKIECHPIQKGVENLFSKKTLEKAIEYKTAFIDITDAYQKRERGEIVPVPEAWTVNENEKTNLCIWLCENGTVEDFEHFRPALEMLREILEETHEEPAE
ncbi:MAG: AAA family ATPase [Nitrospira sp.]|nr:AAA family ATPase [Nitrospira sp.]MDE0486201.1 AAA family ATPase [Nitrospira sp.]